MVIIILVPKSTRLASRAKAVHQLRRMGRILRNRYFVRHTVIVDTEFGNGVLTDREKSCLVQ